MTSFQWLLVLSIVFFTSLRLTEGQAVVLTQPYATVYQRVSHQLWGTVIVYCSVRQHSVDYTSRGNYRAVFPTYSYQCQVNIHSVYVRTTMPANLYDLQVMAGEHHRPPRYTPPLDVPYTLHLDLVPRPPGDLHFIFNAVLSVFNGRRMEGLGLFLRFPLDYPKQWIYGDIVFSAPPDYSTKPCFTDQDRRSVRVDKLRDVFYLEVQSEALTYRQQRRINLGITERVYVPPSTRETVLTFRHSLGSDCRATLNGRVVYFRQNLGVSIDESKVLCSEFWQTRIFSLQITSQSSNNAVYGCRCINLDPIQGLILPEMVEINVELLFMIAPPPPPSQPSLVPQTASPNKDLSVLFSFEGNTLVVPPRNRTAYFDVTVTPATAEITFERISPSDQAETKNPFVISRVSGGHRRISFYNVNANVSEKLTVIATPRRRAVAEGATAHLTCTVTGWPVPRVQWTSGIGLITLSELVKVTTKIVSTKTRESVLHFSSSGFSNSSYYFCTGWNDVEREVVEVIFDVYPIGSPYVDRDLVSEKTTQAPDSDAEYDDFELDLLFAKDDSSDNAPLNHFSVIIIAVMCSLLVTCLTFVVAFVVTKLLLRRRRRKNKK